MKILLLASARSGSTILIRALSKILRLYPYGEPFNYGLPNRPDTYPFALQSRSIVKTLVHQRPEKYYGEEDFYQIYKREFDKVILLTRKNLQQTYESLSYNVHNHPNGDWPFRYWYKKVPFNQELYDSVGLQYKQILQYSKKWDIPVTYYENLYSGNKEIIYECIKTWNLKVDYDKLYHFIDPKNRYRKEGKPDNFL